jgi:CRP-like cAMP-binding protein
MMEGELGKTYADGEVICKEGEKGDVMYVVQSGKVEITKMTPSGELEVAILEKGEIFGEMALFDRMPRSATARASGDTRILSINKKKLFQTINRDPTLVFKMLDSMSKRIRRLTEEFALLRKNKSALLHLYTDIKKTCELILDEAKAIIPADNGSIMLFDQEHNALSVRAAFGSESDRKLKFEPGEGIAGDVFKTGQAELVNNVSLDSRFVSGEMYIKSMLCVPLKCKEYKFGVINISNQSEKLFAIEELKLLRTLAIYASIAILNAQNFSKLNTATDKMLKHATILDMW